MVYSNLVHQLKQYEPLKTLFVGDKIKKIEKKLFFPLFRHYWIKKRFTLP